jgi:hypothetical protein
MKTVGDTLLPFELQDQNGGVVRDSGLRGTLPSCWPRRVRLSRD